MTTKRSRILRFGTARLVALSAAVALGLGSATASELTIGVWDDNGALLTEADVTGTGLLGTAKATPLGDGMFGLSDAGIPIVGGLKTSVTVSDSVWGSASFDLEFTSATELRLDVIFTGQGQAEALSPDLLPSQGGSGDGTAANDLCENAEPIAVNSTAVGSTLDATFDDAGLCVTSNTAPGVWYSVEGTGTTMTASTCSAFFDYDTKISVFCGDCGDLDCVGGNDDNCPPPGASGLLSSVSWCSQAGATYLILVHGFSSGVGNFNLAVSADAFPCSDPIECIPPEPVGACCLDSGLCFLLTQDECEAQGGTYQGDLTDCFDSGDPTTITSTPNAPIPDNDPGGISDTISVGPDFLVADVNVGLTIDHTWQGDLIVTLSHGGDSVVIVDRPGSPALGTFGCSTDNYAGICLDDQGTGGDIEDQCVDNLSSPPNYVPNNSLNATFGGTLSGGDWTINVTDNAGADLGTLVSWDLKLTAAGASICEQECFLVIGDGQGDAPFVGGLNVFDTQVGPEIEDYYPVLMDNIPEFVLPGVKPQRAQRGAAIVGGGMLGGNQTPQLHGPDSPSWMLDGQFAVQVMMWNPGVFPTLPEQFSVGLMVTVNPNGTVTTVPYGEAVGVIELWSELDVNAEGQTVIRFPFFVDMP